MSVLEDLRQKREMAQIKPVEEPNALNVPDDSSGESQISQGNEVNEPKTEPFVSQQAEIPSLMSAVKSGTPFYEAFSSVYSSPELSKEDQERRDKRESARRNIAAFGDAARLIGQGISAFNGGRVNIDQTSLSRENGRREDRQYNQHLDKLYRYKDGAYRSKMADLNYNLSEVARKRQEERELAIWKNKLDREDAKIARELEKDKADKDWKEQQAEKDRRFKAEQNGKKNATTIAAANLRKKEGNSDSDKNMYVLTGADGVTQYQIPKNAKNAVIGNAFSILRESIKDKPDDAKTIDDIMSEYSSTDRMTAMEAAVVFMARKYPDIEQYLQSFTEASRSEVNEPVNAAPSNKKVIPGFSQSSKKRIPGF